MALTPESERHLLQIQAGTLGRKKGHDFEDIVSSEINNLNKEDLKLLNQEPAKHDFLFKGKPSESLVKFLINYSQKRIIDFKCFSTGKLATAEKENKETILIENRPITSTKSDLIINIRYEDNTEEMLGVSTKQCNNKSPTNAQLFFTTATAFVEILEKNKISCPTCALDAMRQFCGDVGFRPLDDPKNIIDRATDNRRFFWEEVDSLGKKFWEDLFEKEQFLISKILFTKGYKNDVLEPSFLIHKTKKIERPLPEEVAIFKIDDLIKKSMNYSGFLHKEYSVKKGSFKDPEGVKHQAPRFGIIQMQRGGQKQHPTQLQFNLQAGYFYKI
jgi:hypothetical protein